MMKRQQPAGYSDAELSDYLLDPARRASTIATLRRYLADRNKDDSPKRASYQRKLAELEHLERVNLRPAELVNLDGVNLRP